MCIFLIGSLDIVHWELLTDAEKAIKLKHTFPPIVLIKVEKKTWQRCPSGG